MKLLEEVGNKLTRALGGDTQVNSKNHDARDLSDHVFIEASFHRLLPYSLYDTEHDLFINKESVGFVLEVIPLLGADDAVQRELTSIFQEILPEGSAMQCLLWADHRISRFLELWQKPRSCGEKIFSELSKRRAGLFEKLVTESDHSPPPRLFKCILSYSFPRPETITNEFLQGIKDTQQRMMKTLSNLTAVFAWDATHLLQCLDGLINFEWSPNVMPRKWNKLEELASQIPCKGGELHVSPDHLAWEKEAETHFKSYQVSDFPDMWSSHDMQKLIGDLFKEPFRLQTPFFIHFGVFLPPQTKQRALLNRKMQLVENQGKSATLRKMIPELAQELSDFDFARRQTRQGEKIVWSQLSCGIWAKPEQLQTADESIRSLFRLNQFRLSECKFTHLIQLLSALPMSWGHAARELKEMGFLRTSLAQETGNFLPIQGEWWGTPSSGMLLQGRRGQIMTWNPFDNRGGNYNVIVVGRSGSGKSVFMQDLLINSLSTGARVFVLDVGRSFEKTCRLIGGQFIEFSNKMNLCLNPFTHVSQEDSESQDTALAMIKSILATMASPTSQATDLENAFLEKAIRFVWNQKGSQATVTDVALWLQEQTHATAQNLGMMLIGFTKEGVYGRFFEGANNVNFDRSMVVIELEELKERKDLQAVVLQLFIMTITNQTFLGDRKTPFHICIDEAWDLLRSPQAGLFIETLARRLRKYNGSLVIGTQSVEDFYQAPGALAAFENSDWMCFLAQKSSSVSRLKQSGKIDLNDAQEALMHSLTTKQGAYSEVMICDAEGFYSVCRFKLDPFSGLLYSTKADEYSRIEQLCAEGMEISEAIALLLQEKGKKA